TTIPARTVRLAEPAWRGRLSLLNDAAAVMASAFLAVVVVGCVRGDLALRRLDVAQREARAPLVGTPGRLRLLPQVRGGEPPDPVVADEDDDRARGDAGDREGASDLDGQVPDARDDARGQRDEVDRVGEVDPVLDPDLRPEQADHPVEDQGDAAEDAAGRR